MVLLPVSVTMSWPTKSTKKLNMSGYDFLALVLQSSNSFNQNVFFFIFSAVYFFLVTRSVVNCCIQRLCAPRGCLVNARSVFRFFPLNYSNFFPLSPCFREVLHFFYVLLVMMGFSNCACTSQLCQHQWLCHHQPRLHKT